MPKITIPPNVQHGTPLYRLYQQYKKGRITKAHFDQLKSTMVAVKHERVKANPKTPLRAPSVIADKNAVGQEKARQRQSELAAAAREAKQVEAARSERSMVESLIDDLATIKEHDLIKKIAELKAGHKTTQTFINQLMDSAYRNWQVQQLSEENLLMLSIALRANGLFVNFGSQRFSIGKLSEDATDAIGLEVIAHNRQEPYKVLGAVAGSNRSRELDKLLDCSFLDLPGSIEAHRKEIEGFGVDKFLELALERFQKGHFTEPVLYGLSIALRSCNLFASSGSKFIQFCQERGILLDETQRHRDRSTADLYA